jgi:hypothetical protein
MRLDKRIQLHIRGGNNIHNEQTSQTSHKKKSIDQPLKTKIRTNKFLWWTFISAKAASTSMSSVVVHSNEWTLKERKKERKKEERKKERKKENLLDEKESFIIEKET